jgi:hypothetical protein
VCARLLEGALMHDAALAPAFAELARALPAELLVRLDATVRAPFFTALLGIARAHGDVGLAALRVPWRENFALLLRVRAVTPALARLAVRGASQLAAAEHPALAATAFAVLADALQNTGIECFTAGLVRAAGPLCARFPSAELDACARECVRLLGDALAQLASARAPDIPKAAGRIASAVGFRAKCAEAGSRAAALSLGRRDVARLKKEYACTALFGPLDALYGQLPPD